MEYVIVLSAHPSLDMLVLSFQTSYVLISRLPFYNYFRSTFAITIMVRLLWLLCTYLIDESIFTWNFRKSSTAAGQTGIWYWAWIWLAV